MFACMAYTRTQRVLGKERKSNALANIFQWNPVEWWRGFPLVVQWRQYSITAPYPFTDFKIGKISRWLLPLSGETIGKPSDTHTDTHGCVLDSGLENVDSLWHRIRVTIHRKPFAEYKCVVCFNARGSCCLVKFSVVVFYSLLIRLVRFFSFKSKISDYCARSTVYFSPCLKGCIYIQSAEYRESDAHSAHHYRFTKFTYQPPSLALSLWVVCESIRCEIGIANLYTRICVVSVVVCVLFFGMLEIEGYTSLVPWYRATVSIQTLLWNIIDKRFTVLKNKNSSTKK